MRATAPFVETGVHGPRDDAGAGGGRRRGAGPPPPRASRSAGGGPTRGAADADAKPSWLRPGADVDRAPGAFLLVQTLGPLAVLAVPSTPIFGGVKHFMTAMPYLAVLAGIGVARLAAACSPAVLPAARARLRAARAGRARGARLPARGRRDAALAPRRAVALQPARGRLRGRRVAGDEPAVLGLLACCRCCDVIDRDTPRIVRCIGTTSSTMRSRMYKRDGRLAMSVGDTGFGEEALRRSQIGHPVLREALGDLRRLVLGQLRHDASRFVVREREGVPLVTIYRRGPP